MIFQLSKLRPWELVLALGIGATLLVWGGHSYWVILFLLLGLFFFIKTPSEFNFLYKSHPLIDSAVWLLGSWAVYATIKTAIAIWHHNAIAFETISTFALFPLLGLAIFHLKIRPLAIWVGAGIASVAGVAVAIYQSFFLGFQRAQGFKHPITFGDICVMLGMVCVIGATREGFVGKIQRLALCFAGFLAMYASLLSGSKGGWLSMMTVVALGMYRLWTKIRGHQRHYFLAAIIGFAVLGTTFFPHSAIERLSSGFNGAVSWFQTGQVTENSASLRLDLWKFGVQVFKKSPLVGVSNENIGKLKKEAVSNGELSPLALEVNTIDSLYLEDLATGGVMGLLATLILIAGSIRAFYGFKKSSNPQIHDLALIAIWISILFVEFGLSINVWGLSAFRQIYASWLIMLLAMIAVELHKEHHPDSP